MEKWLAKQDNEEIDGEIGGKIRIFENMVTKLEKFEH